jgi:hypothetical protein
MTLEQIDRMVRQANPVPDLKALEPVDASVLVLDQQRRTEMQTNDRVEVDQGQQKPVRGFLVGIAAVAAVVVGIVILFQSRDGVAPATGVANEFIEAFASFDADRAASLLAADADLIAFDNVDGMRREIRFLEAEGFKLILDSCDEHSTTSAGAEVRCAYAYHTIRSDEIGLGPFGGSYYDFTIRDGEIVSVSGHFEFMRNGFSQQMWEPFADWVAETYPDDVLVMYTDRSQTQQLYTDESIALWEERSREYVEFVQNSG